MSISFKIGEAFARNLDMQDELKSFREEFVIADPDLIYLDGNSLGRLPFSLRGKIFRKSWVRRFGAGSARRTLSALICNTVLPLA